MIKAHYKAEEQVNFNELFIRLIGLVYLFVFFTSLFQFDSLIGVNGIASISEFLKQCKHEYGNFAFLKFPSLFWLSNNNHFISFTLFIGCISSILCFLGFAVSINLALNTIIWLSFINTGSDFFIYIWDTFLLECGLIAFILSCYKSNSNKVIHFMPNLLIFRLWFSMGMVVVYDNQSINLGGDFIKHFFQNQPMPTKLAFYCYHLPNLLHTLMAIILFIVELIVPFFIFIKKLRPIAFWIFFIFSFFIELTGNFAWFNLLTVICSLPLLEGSKANKALQHKFISDFLKRKYYFELKTPKIILIFAYSQISVQILLIIMLFFPIGNRYLNFLNYFDYQKPFSTWEQKNAINKIIASPIHMATAFKIANPYGIFKGIPVKRWELQFELANKDSIIIKKIEYHFKPGFQQKFNYFAPFFPRLEQQLFYESQQGSFYLNYTPFQQKFNQTCWTKKLVLNIIKSGYLDHPVDRKKNNAYELVKISMLEFNYNSLEQYKKTGSMWTFKPIFSFWLNEQTIPCPLISDNYFINFRKHEIN